MLDLAEGVFVPVLKAMFCGFELIWNDFEGVARVSCMPDSVNEIIILWVVNPYCLKTEWFRKIGISGFGDKSDWAVVRFIA